LKSKEPSLGLIVVDYLQLMTSGASVENRVQEVSQISRSLKVLARDLEVPILAMSQLSRAVEQRHDKRPILSDLRECVAGDTPVVLANGRRTPIAELVGTAPLVLALTREGKVVAARSDKVWHVGRRPVFDVTLASGRTMRATAPHRLLTARGWGPLEELEPGDGVAVTRALPEPVRGSSRRRMAALRGTAYGGASRFSFASSGATVAKYEEVLDDLLLEPEAAGDVFWDRVVAVEPAGEEDVYDLTVPGPESWLSDGIVSHNSGAIEQDSDLVAFIYRDEYYNAEESDQQGLAEIILAKHRNGPTGSLKLAFLNRYTKFADLAPM
jgi:replicative DNA helicase